MQDTGMFVGVDMAKMERFAHAVTSDGDELLARSVTNDEVAIEWMIDDAAEHGHTAVVVDMTASGAQLLLSIAARREVAVAYVTGLQMRRAAQLYAGSAKTDPRDAWVLADYARRHTDQLVWLDVSDELLTRLRVLNGRDVDLAGDATRARNRTRDALVAVSPALERVVGPRLHQAGIRDVITKWPTATTLRQAGKTRIRNTIKKRSPRLADKVTLNIWAALDAQTVTLPAEATWGDVISDLVSDLERICCQRDELETVIDEVFLSHPLGKVLVTLCGFGPRTGARTLAEIGDPNRFATGSRLASYAGLAPIDWRSGASTNGSFHSRGGNHRLKNAMFLAAFVATRHDANAKAYYQRKRDEGKKHNAAVICVARRRCDLILAMLKTATTYNANRHEELQNRLTTRQDPPLRCAGQWTRAPIPARSAIGMSEAQVLSPRPVNSVSILSRHQEAAVDATEIATGRSGMSGGQTGDVSGLSGQSDHPLVGIGGRAVAPPSTTMS